MQISLTSIFNLPIIYFGEEYDNRGNSSVIYDTRSFLSLLPMIELPFVREIISQSDKNVLRGMHYQLCAPQGRLIHVLDGKIYDVFVDMRKSSNMFGKWEAVLLLPKRAIYIPPGFAHGFYAVENTRIYYKMTKYYYPKYDKTLLWNDVDVGITWPIVNQNIILSKKDRRGKTFKNIIEDNEIYE